jgi:hypothetical protein
LEYQSAKKPIYNVYVDETFEHFLNLPRLDGYLCYGALMVPETREKSLSDFWAALDRRLRCYYKAATGIELSGEFKSTYLKKLSPEDRLDISQRIGYFLSKNSAWIVGFYTSVHALICWELRTQASYDESETLPPYDEAAIVQRANKLRGEKNKGFGESELLKGLFHTISSIPLSWLGVLGAQFRMRYDSRHPKEDRILLGLLDEFFPGMTRLHKGLMADYLGGTGLDSANVPGLLLVDLICKEIRNFIHAVPELLTDNSYYRPITPRSREGVIIPVEIGGHLMKWGSAKRMSAATVGKLEAAKRETAFGTWLNSVADGKLSCYGHFGEGRVADLINHVFNDQVD